MARQFDNVSSKWGAPMGRMEYGRPDDCESKSVRLFKVNIDSGGYDDGGAYWGTGQRLYCAQDAAGEYRRFTRANSRHAAAVNLSIPPGKLARR